MKYFLGLFLPILFSLHLNADEPGGFIRSSSGLFIPQGCNSKLLNINKAHIYSIDEVEEASKKAKSEENKKLADFYEVMKKRGGTRSLFTVPEDSAFDELKNGSPNFTEIADDLKVFANLYRSANEHMQFTPMLLLGDPGVGKTYFAKKLAERIGTHFEKISMEGVTAGWVLTGNSAQWNEAQAGRIGHALIHGNAANPIILLDEIDKAGGDRRFDPVSVLHTLLEPDSAKTFRDEFVNIEMDAHHVLWIVTANNVDKIPDTIQSRMVVYEIPKPDKEQMIVISKNIYTEILSEHTGWKFDPTPSQSVLDKLTGRSPRELKQALLAAFPRAFNAGRTALSPDDIVFKKVQVKKNPIGFMPLN